MVEWGHLDYMIVDLPPGTGDIALSLVQNVPLTGAVVVSTPSDVSLQDARKAIEMFKQMKVDLVGVVENMSYFVCPHCSHEIDIFSRGGAENMAKQFGVSFLETLRSIPRYANPATAESRSCSKERTRRMPSRSSSLRGEWLREWERSKRAKAPASFRFNRVRIQ